MPTKLADTEPGDASGPRAPDEQPSAEPSHANPSARARTLAGRYIAAHPAVWRVLEWLGWNNPGGSINP